MGKLKRIAKEYDRLFESMERADERGNANYVKRCMDVIDGMNFVLHAMGYERYCDGEKQIIVRR